MSTLYSVIVAGQSFYFWSIMAMGACVGSFMNVCILRIPEQSFFSHLRSVCPSCGKQIPAWLNIPIFGFFMLRGRAQCCSAKLSWQYPLIEIAGALIFAGMYLKFPFLGWSISGSEFEINQFTNKQQRSDEFLIHFHFIFKKIPKNLIQFNLI